MDFIEVWLHLAAVAEHTVALCVYQKPPEVYLTALSCCWPQSSYHGFDWKMTCSPSLWLTDSAVHQVTFEVCIIVIVLEPLILTSIFRLLAQWCYFALQVPHRVTHAFWWAWLQTRGKLAIIFALRRETTLWCRDLLNNTRGSSFFPCCASSPSPSLSCWCSLCRTRPSHWCRVWRTRSPNTAACLCWPLLRAPCAPRWSSQVSTCSLLLSCPLLGRVVIFVPHLSLLHPIVLGFFSLSSNITTRAVPCYGDRRLL